LHPGTTDPKSISVFACENQPVVVAGLESVLARFPDIRFAGHAPSVEAARSAIAPSDILLLCQAPVMRSPLPMLVQARQAQLPGTMVVWVAEMSEMDVFRALQMAARGIIRRTQSPEALVECFRAVHSGSVWLDPSLRTRPPVRASTRVTPREREIVELVCRGLRNRDIAEAMAITPGTVKVHLMHIFEKTGVRDRFQLALYGKQILACADDEKAHSAGM
jgi:two-component system, NarL family, nitrate/nitrite response regulator NarL